MSHAIQILTFDGKMDKKKIQARCDEWGDRNCSLEERGCYDGKLGEFTSGRFGGLGSSIKFTDKVFNNYEDAEEYLMTTTGDYRQIAVKYKEYPKTKPNKTISDLESRIMEYRRKIEVLNQPHYMGVKQATVKCKACGSSIATRFCGKTFKNNCPVCRVELRPQSMLDKLGKYEATVKELEKKLKAEQKKQNQKNESKVEYRWAVCCEVHC